MKTATISLFTLVTLITLTCSGCLTYQQTETLFSCYDSCEAQAQGTGCSDQVAEEWPMDCYDICDAFVASFADDDTCLKALEDLHTCQLDMEWLCAEGGEMPLTRFGDTTCEAEYDAVSAVCDYDTGEPR